MKNETETIYLTEDDNESAVVEKIKNSPAREIILVAFSEASPLLSVVNLKLLKKFAAGLGKELVISTNNEAIKILAQNAEIKIKILPDKTNTFKNFFAKGTGSGLKPVDSIIFGGEKKFQPASPSLGGEEEGLRERPGQFRVSGANKNIFWAFIAAAALVAGGALFFLLPTAKITVSPRIEPINIGIDFILNKNISSAEISSKQIPATVITGETEKSREFNATGSKKVESRATGIITVYNEWSSSSQSLVSGTRFLSNSGKLFKTNKTIAVPGFTREDGKDIPGSIEVPVTAWGLGPDYNIPADDFSLPGLSGSPKYGKIYAKSFAPTAGGASGLTTVVASSDLQKAKEFLESEIKQEISAQLLEKKPADLVLLDKTMSFIDEDFSASAKIDQPANKFEASLKMAGVAFLFNPKDIQSIIDDIIKNGSNAAGEEKSGLVILNPKIDYGDVSVLGPDKIKIGLRYQANSYKPIDEQDLKSALSGKTAEQINSYLKNKSSELSKIEVSFWPLWVKRVPLIDKNISIILDIPNNNK